MIRAKQEKSHIVIDLTGPEGNAFYLIGLARNLAKQLMYTKEEVERMSKDLMSGSYEELILKFDDAFGDYVILER